MFQITISGIDEEMAPKHTEERTQRDYELLQNTATIRDGQRLPTPDRRAVIELSDTPEIKHQLKRQQQLLTDIAQRAREQEITALSGALSKKCTLDDFDRKHERPHLSDPSALRKYTTNSSVTMNKSENGLKITLAGISEQDSPLESTPAETLQNIQARPEFNRSTTFFPKRKLRKPQRVPGKWKSLPRLQIAYSKGLMPTTSMTQHQHTVKTNLIRSRNINGPIQLKHYIQPKDPLAPLILPSITNNDSDLDRVDSFIKSSPVPMKQRSKTVFEGFSSK